MGSCEVVEDLEEDHSSSHLGPIFTETVALADQWRQGMPYGQVQSFDQAGADREAQVFQPLSTAEHAVSQLFEAPLLLLFDDLAIDQVGMGGLDGLSGASRLAGPRKDRERMVAGDQGRQIGAQPITEKGGNPSHHGSGQLDEGQGTLPGPGAHHGSQDEPKLGSETQPDPLAAILAQVRTLPIGASLGRVLAPNEVPHLIELHLGHRQLLEQVRIDLVRLLRRTPEPLQHGCFGNPQDKADPRQINFDQKHLQSKHHRFLRRPQIKEDRFPRLRERGAADTAPKDPALPALGQIGRNSANVSPVQQPIMRTVGIGARLAPVLGRFHWPILQICWFLTKLTYRKIGLFTLFQSTIG